MMTIKNKELCLTLELTVVPASGRSDLIIDKEGRLRCYLKSQAEKGKANKELVSLLAQKIGVRQQDITILSGELGRKKRIKIATSITKEELFSLCQLSKQQKLFE